MAFISITRVLLLIELPIWLVLMVFTLYKNSTQLVNGKNQEQVTITCLYPTHSISQYWMVLHAQLVDRLAVLAYRTKVSLLSIITSGMVLHPQQQPFGPILQLMVQFHPALALLLPLPTAVVELSQAPVIWLLELLRVLLHLHSRLNSKTMLVSALVDLFPQDLMFSPRRYSFQRLRTLYILTQAPHLLKQSQELATPPLALQLQPHLPTP